MNKLRPEKYLKYLYLPNLFTAKRTKEILSVNPTVIPQREEAESVRIFVYDYNAERFEVNEFDSVRKIFSFKDNENTTWVNIDGLRKADVEAVCNHYDIHPLFIEDILSINQRPKLDETENTIFCLLNMLYYDDENFSVEQEQISIVLCKNTVISFQEDPRRDVFNTVREKLKMSNTKLRQGSAEYLCYTLLDTIVDHYFLVMEKLGGRIEDVEEVVARGHNPRAITDITNLRKELIILKRNFIPVREVVNGFIRSESDLLEDRYTKYYKDVYDHIIQAIDLLENYRDVIVSLQDLHINNVNLKMNEVMKVMAIVTCLLAPATVIGGIFGMNFENVPLLKDHWGFWIAMAFMLIIPLWMLRIFRSRGWF
ncbi:MAG: magnesium/cobalt transporter CorA [Chitinophagaceae bacterium]|nr:magnesium/cobalt transporter CorA [Chitinophagaceae bacterium]MCB9055043.1 magnesium/cobalt transporter CorA [Chitinophagales bacterium]